MQPVTSELKPSPFFVAMSLLVIAGCILLVSMLPGVAVVWDPFLAVLVGVLLVPMATALGIAQYRAVFCSPRAARTAATLLFIISGLLLAIPASAFWETAAAGENPSWIWNLSPIAAMGAFCIIVAALNRRWARRILSTGPPTRRAERQPGQHSSQDYVAAVSAVAAVIALATYFVISAPPEYAQHVEPSKTLLDLPPGARDVSYRRGSRGTMTAEFTTDEASFRQWLESDSRFSRSRSPEPKMGEIVEPYTICRYDRPNADPGEPDVITVTQGLYYEWSKEDRGVHAAFDRTTSRAYYHVHYH
jgi:hypothetical protein